MYSEQELQIARDCIDGTIQTLDYVPLGMFVTETTHAHVDRVLHPLSICNPVLFHKIACDPVVKKFGYPVFLPQLYPWVYKDPEQVTMQWASEGTRGEVKKFTYPGGRCIVKPLQSEDEKSIASLAAELNIGPQQFPSIRTVLTEEWIVDPSLAEFVPGQMTHEDFGLIGQSFGINYSTLHNEGIIYQDPQLIHVFPRKKQGNKLPVTMIDFGSAERDADAYLKSMDLKILTTFFKKLPGVIGFEAAQFVVEGFWKAYKANRRPE